MLVAKIKTNQRTEVLKYILKPTKTFEYLGKKYNINSADIYRKKFLWMFGYNCIDYVQDIADSVNYFDVDREGMSRSYEGINDTIKAWKLASSKQWILYACILAGVAAAVSGVGVAMLYSIMQHLGV